MAWCCIERTAAPSIRYRSLIPSSWTRSRRRCWFSKRQGAQFPSLGIEGKEMHYQAMMDSILAGVMLIDAKDHRIVDINAAAAWMIGTPAEELIGSCCHDVICPAERGRCPITDLKMSMDRSERVLITADGTRCSILKSVSPFWVQGHQYLLESFVDITDRVKAEHAINQANKKLNILSSVTRHDILNQLTVLRGYLTLTEDAAEDAGISETTGPYLQQIEKVARTIRLQIEFTRDYQDIGIQAPGWHRIGLILDYVTSTARFRGGHGGERRRGARDLCRPADHRGLLQPAGQCPQACRTADPDHGLLQRGS